MPGSFSPKAGLRQRRMSLGRTPPVKKGIYYSFHSSFTFVSFELPCMFDSLKKIFTSKVDMVVDAGDLPHSLPSTVIDVSDEKARIVREGAISKKGLY